MNEPQPSTSEETSAAPKWQPIGSIDRRLLGVLVEKAKTTPDQYPLSLNALRSGANQKSNRSPQMNLETTDIEESLERLRQLGAVAEVRGGGRVGRYRHYLYDWLGVDKTELAVMAELLLRGTQTVGELRGRAARMEPIADVASLRPILRSLIDKGLVISLTPEGRGQTVTHSLYREQELEKVMRDFGSGGPPTPEPAGPAIPAQAPSQAPAIPTSVAPRSDNVHSDSADSGTVQQLSQEVGALRDEVARLRSEVEDIWSNLNS